ncbi:uncharacterized protein LOC132584623 [Heteronotia binoei]|uniref:uncharacterized protein LOC132584623 n=1 Tax=Heteronotia binoei TaxID=13085 RepID=UPI00292F7D98|nr:uncharacterized protein LOC132584623 [Heteronotia binoei]
MGQQTAPSVFPLVSCCSSTTEELQGNVTFACLAAEYFPSNAEITWEPHDAKRIQTFPETIASGSNRLYKRSSQFTVPSADFKANTYTCIVKHAAIGKQEGKRKRIENKECTERNPTPIQVRLSTPDCDAENTETNLELVCILLSSGPGQAKVEWLINGAVEQTREKVTLTAHDSNSYSSYITQNITKKSWDKEDHYTCRVTHLPKTQNVEMYNTSKCKACYKLMQVPTTTITKPSYRDLVEGKAIITCLVEGFFLEKIQITWNVNGKPSTNRQAGIVKSGAGGQQNAKSSHSVSPEQWEQGTTFQCKVAIMCLKETTKEVTIKKDTHIRTTMPIITISQAYRDISSNSNIAQILVCDVSGFFPMEISISWKKNSMLLNTSLYDNGPVMSSGKVYITYSILRIGRNEGGNGRDSYTCVVHHPSSPKPITADETVSFDSLEPTSPQVMAFHTSEKEARHKLICFATGFQPKNIDIHWSVPGTNLTCSSNSSALVALSDGKYQKSCNLEFSEEDWRKPQTYTCTVNHSSSNTLIKKVLHSSGMVSAPINTTIMTIEPPSFEDLFTNKSAALTCMAPLADAMMNWTVIWLMDGQPASTQAVSTEVLNKTTSTALIHSQLMVNLAEWKGTIKFTCSISTGLGEVKQVYERRNGTMKSPKVSLQQQSSQEDLNVTIFCIATDFYPGEVFVKWQEENMEMSLKGHDAHDLKCDHKRDRCSLLSILEVPRSQWMMGVSYMCLVAHVSSANIIFRRINSHSDSWGCAVTTADICGTCNETEDEYSELPEMDAAWNRVSTYLILFLLALFYGGLVTFFKVTDQQGTVQAFPSKVTAIQRTPQSAPSLFPLIVPSESIPSNGLVTVGCLAKDVMPDVVSFTWNDQNNVSIDANYVKQLPSVFNPSGTFTSSSQVAISANDWRNFEPFYCKATNKAGTGVVRVTRQTSCLKPEMIIRAPRLEDFENSDPNATIVCMAVNLQTDRATVQWLKDGHALNSGFATTGPAVMGRDGYRIISELTVDKRDWVSDKTFSCEVHNKNFTSIKNISKSLVCDTGPCTELKVQVKTIPPSFTDIYLTKSAKITCRISNIPYDQDLKELEVIWTRERDNTQLETITGLATAQEDNAFIFVDATATVCPEEWDSGDTFKCKVTIPSLLPTAETRTLQKLKGSTYQAPAVYVLPPPSEQLDLQETATITCLIKGFYPNDFFVKWLRNDEPMGDSEYFISKPIQESKTPERYFTSSMLNVNEQDWSYGARYTCVVGHEALPLQTTQKTVDKNTGKPTLVNVSLVLSETTKTCY